MLITKTKLDVDDYNLLLCSDLIDKAGNNYDLTLIEALEEHTHGKELVWCKYTIEVSKYDTKLVDFLAYTQDKVIFIVKGICTADVLLSSVKRNPE